MFKLKAAIKYDFQYLVTISTKKLIVPSFYKYIYIVQIIIKSPKYTKLSFYTIC